MTKDCIECKVRPARYWDSSFCEECFREVLRQKLDEEDICEKEVEFKPAGKDHPYGKVTFSKLML